MQVMDAFETLLATANTKLNSVALEAMPRLILLFGDGMRESLGKLLPDIFKLLQSKANSELALKVLDTMVLKMGMLEYFMFPFSKKLTKGL